MTPLWLTIVALARRAWAHPLARPATYVGAGCIVLVLYTFSVAHLARKGVADRVQTRIVTKIEKAQGKETVRRETVLHTVQVRSQADIRKLAQQATRIVELQQESTRASLAHDADACLDAAAVMRLAAVR